jgi:hypothetical protein
VKYILLKIVAVVCVISIFSMSIPKTNAQAGCNAPGCFGGVDVFNFVCPCSGNFLIFFAPLYLYGIPAPIIGPMGYEAGTIAYSGYEISPTEAAIGTYVQGVPTCYIYIGTGCVSLPSYGYILPFTGSSQPGGGLI